MARARLIANAITFDKRVAELSDDTSRLGFTWLITFADVEGRAPGDPALVRSMLFPRRSDVTIDLMEAYIREWAAAGLIVWYEAKGDRFIYFPGFSKNQMGIRRDREARSIIPAPPGYSDSDLDDELGDDYDDFEANSSQKNNSGVTPQHVSTSGGVTPELVRSDAGVTPEQLPVKLKEIKLKKVVESKSQNRSRLTGDPRKKSPEPTTTHYFAYPKTPIEAGDHPDIRVYRRITRRLPEVKSYAMVVDTVRSLRTVYPADDDLVAYLEPFWEAWSGRKDKKGKPYSPSRLDWLTDWALNGDIPPAPKAEDDGYELVTLDDIQESSGG